MRGTQHSLQLREQVPGCKVIKDCSCWHPCWKWPESCNLLQVWLLLTQDAKSSPVKAWWQVLGRGTQTNLHMHH